MLASDVSLQQLNPPLAVTSSHPRMLLTANKKQQAH